MTAVNLDPWPPRVTKSGNDLRALCNLGRVTCACAAISGKAQSKRLVCSAVVLLLHETGQEGLVRAGKTLGCRVHGSFQGGAHSQNLFG